ncbi:hypothetical protein FSP39_008444 [Pinctada imbricata]|uniref:Sialate O-acetylesterase domain-containing protein n=1 Tax=Pinctada imbricata TaxID=66713 RepID=A0AA88YDI0_PINIB|nr:hypothetical protein FSP39_008444 [Pinctada imbricata]
MYSYLCIGPGTFSFASYYGDNMVLEQAPQRAVIWGYTEKVGENITGTMHTTPIIITTVISTYKPNVKGAVWRIVFPTQLPSTTGIKVEVSRTNGQKISISNVLFGDVWVCSGQSNMQFTLDMAFNATEELEDAKNYPNIRVFTASEETSSVPELDLKGVEEIWSMPSKDTLGHKPWTYFSAVCWLYGKYLYQNLKVPIGLVSSTWGGTAIELWSSTDALKKCNIPPDAQTKGYVTDHGWVRIGNSELWNAMMHPFINMTIKGVIWYQGEANAGSPASYLCTFPTMINDWREKFNQGNPENDAMFPFGFVQLAGYRNQTIKTGFPDIRWHQTADMGYVPNPTLQKVFMAVAMDLPDFTSPEGSVHPRDKQDVAARLALSGLTVAYGKDQGNFQGPKISAFYIDIGFFTLCLEFDSSKTTLDVRSNNGFEVCCSRNNQSKCDGTDSTWMDTPIIKHDAHSVTLSYNGTCANKYVMGLRYAWQESPCEFKKCAVYITENNMPLAPFVELGLIGKVHTEKYLRSNIPVHVTKDGGCSFN